MLKELYETIARFKGLLLVVPLIILSGMIFSPLSYIIAIGFITIMVNINRMHEVFAFMIIVFIMGESRAEIFSVFTPLRTVCILFFIFKTISDIINVKYKYNHVFTAIIPFVLSSIASLLSSPVIFLAVPRLISYVGIFFVSFNYIYNNMSKQFLSDLLRMNALFNILGLAAIVVMPGVVWYDGGNRFNGLFGNPNSVAVYSAIYFILYSIYFFDINRYENKQIKIYYFLLMVMPLILSRSRNGIITILLFVVLYAIAHARIIYQILYISVFTPFVILFSNPDNLSLLLGRLGLQQQLRAESLKDGGGRFIAWRIATEEISRYPLLGRGFYYQEFLFNGELSLVLRDLGHIGDVHNSYLAFLMNAGYIGTFLILLYIIYLTYNIENKMYFIPILGAIGFNAFFEPWLTSSLSPFMISFLILLIMLFQYNKLKKEFLADDNLSPIL